MLAIGIVVDDAIVVVENVERNIEEGLVPRARTQAMWEVTGPIIAIALVLCAVFVPMAFISGLTGQFYRQFALTIAFSTVISAFNSLTLSPALAAMLLRGHDAPKDWLARGMDEALGWLLQPLQSPLPPQFRELSRYGGAYTTSPDPALVVYAVCWRRPYCLFHLVPRGFIPTQDKQYLVCWRASCPKVLRTPAPDGDRQDDPGGCTVVDACR